MTEYPPPFNDHVDSWISKMESLLREASRWGAHVKVNGNQDLTSMSIDVIVAPPMRHADVEMPVIREGSL